MPLGAQLLGDYLNMSVCAAAMHHGMAAWTKLGLLEQPHAAAGRVPNYKGYRYYIENILDEPAQITPREKSKLNEMFRSLDHDPEKLAQGAAAAFSELLGHVVVTTTPRAEDMRIAHFEVMQVGRYSAVVLAVTNGGGVRTRVAKTDFEMSAEKARNAANALNQHLRFVAEADVTPGTIRDVVDGLGEGGGRYWPILSAAITLLSEVGKASVYFEGQQYLLHWPELEDNLRRLLELFNDGERLFGLIQPHNTHTTVEFGDEWEDPMPGLCLVSRRYLAGGGLSGAIAVAGPARMLFNEIIPQLEYFSGLLGKAMSGQ